MLEKDDFEANTDYKWMTCCGITTFLFFGLLFIFFVSSFSQNIGGRVATLTYLEDKSVPSFDVSYSNQAFPANFRVNLDKN
jgi:hypothetical protein